MGRPQLGLREGSLKMSTPDSRSKARQIMPSLFAPIGSCVCTICRLSLRGFVPGGIQPPCADTSAELFSAGRAGAPIRWMAMWLTTNERWTSHQLLDRVDEAHGGGCRRFISRREGDNEKITHHPGPDSDRFVRNLRALARSRTAKVDRIDSDAGSSRRRF